MGANIGTTVTNTLVSFGHITRSQEFSRAFPAAIVHDLFNILSVLVLFPLEVHFHLLQKLSFGFVQAFQGLGGMTITSPFKFLVEPAASGIAELLGSPILVLTIALLGLFTALKFLVSSIRALVSRKLEVFLDRYLFGAAWKSFLLGLLLTSIIQSSSVITSIIVPLVGAGLLTIEKVFPYTLGANLGTTVTALLASFATGEVVAVQAAFAHLGFNLLGCAIWYPLRRAPIGLAKALGGIVARHRVMGIVWIGVVFFLIPIIIILLF
jgi:sodium-dependent phosphate cotransporter